MKSLKYGARLGAPFALVLAAMGLASSSWAQTVKPKQRLYVAPLQTGADYVDPALFEALRARIEEGLAATKVFEIETRLDTEVDAIVAEAEFVRRAQNRSIDLIIFPIVDSITCYQEARPITRAQGKFNHKAKCDSIMRVRVVSPKTDTLRTSFELDESLEKRLGVVDVQELPFAPMRDGQYRAPIKVGAQTREFVELAQQLSSALANRVYEDAYPPEIIEVIGDQLYLSRGRRGGFNVGDVLTIQSKTGKILYHPVTGEKLGEAAVSGGSVRVTESYDDYSVAVAIEPGQTPAKGSIVRRLEN